MGGPGGPAGALCHRRSGSAHTRLATDCRAEELSCVGYLSHASSGRKMTVFSSEPICQTYYSTLLGGFDAAACKGGANYGKHGAICLEMHRHANAVNISSFPSNILRPGETYRQLTVYKFTVKHRTNEVGRVQSRSRADAGRERTCSVER